MVMGGLVVYWEWVVEALFIVAQMQFLMSIQHVVDAEALYADAVRRGSGWGLGRG